MFQILLKAVIDYQNNRIVNFGYGNFFAYSSLSIYAYVTDIFSISSIHVKNSIV